MTDGVCGSEEAAVSAVAAGEPMRVLERAIYRGPHYFSATPMIRVQLDLGSLEAWR